MGIKLNDAETNQENLPPRS